MSSACHLAPVSRAIPRLWSDSDLVAAVQEDDATAFARLVSRHRGAVLRTIRRHVGGTEEAWDVLQDTFLSAWIALDQYEKGRPFQAWIRTIAINKCRDRARRAAVRAGISRSWDMDDMRDIADSTPGPADLLETEQTLNRLRGGLTKLSSSLREPLLLTAVEGMSHLQAGNVLGISAKAVEVRVYRARMRLEGLR
jgi:RNA polymerase sigma-70 factor (ECF subfamily)